MRKHEVKKRGYSELTRRLIRENEAAIRIRRQSVAKTKREIEALKKQNRELMGRESHEDTDTQAYEPETF